MDKKVELIEQLLLLSKSASAIAKLLSADLIISAKDDEPLHITSDKILTVADWDLWPKASIAYDEHIKSAKLDLDNQSVLEISLGTRPVSIYHDKARIDLITDSMIQQPKNVRIINWDEMAEQYDTGVIWESIEFLENPIEKLIQLKKKCKKIILKVRPWTSRNGAFQSDFMNRAYAHLIIPIDHQVKFKVIRPLATYESMFNKVGLAIAQRAIEHIPIDDFLIKHKEFIDVAIARTWGQIREEDALKIMSTNTIEYTLI